MLALNDILTIPSMSSAARSSAILLAAVGFGLVLIAFAPTANAQTNACVNVSNTLRLGSTDAKTQGEVTKLQEFLTQTGDYTYGSATGYFGPATEAAVKRFQCREGIVCEGTAIGSGYGVVGARTRAAMRCEIGDGGGVGEGVFGQCVVLQRYLYLGHADATTGGEVSKLQRMLNKVGVYTAAINGTFDAATETAVKRFQCAKNISCSGNADTTGYGSVGPRTRTLLYSSCRAGEIIGEGTIQCPQDAMRCADGSWVSRSGPQCTFSCPGGIATTTGPIIQTFDGPSTLQTYESGRWTINATGSDVLTFKVNWGDGSSSGPLFANSFLHSYSSNGTFTIEATVSDLDSHETRSRRTVTVGTSPVGPPGTPVESMTLSASPTSITQGQSVTLSWSVPSVSQIGYSTSCSLFANGTQIASGLGGNRTYTHAPGYTTTYRIECNLTGANLALRSFSGSVEVGVSSTPDPIPGGTMSLNASASSIATGQSVTLSWATPQFTTDAASCTLYANNVQIASGLSSVRSYSHTPSVSTTYRIVCSDHLLRAYSASVVVTVGAPTTAGGQCTQEARQCPDGSYVGRTGASCAFAACPTGNGSDNGYGYMILNASPASVIAGQSVTLSWTPPQATFSTPSCSLHANDVQIATGLTSARTYVHAPSGSTTYRVTCGGIGWSTTYSGTVYVPVAVPGGTSAAPAKANMAAVLVAFDEVLKSLTDYIQQLGN